jgi:hypothetical protein
MIQLGHRFIVPGLPVLALFFKEATSMLCICPHCEERIFLTSTQVCPSCHMVVDKPRKIGAPQGTSAAATRAAGNAAAGTPASKLTKSREGLPSNLRGQDGAAKRANAPRAAHSAPPRLRRSVVAGSAVAALVVLAGVGVWFGFLRDRTPEKPEANEPSSISSSSSSDNYPGRYSANYTPANQAAYSPPRQKLERQADGSVVVYREWEENGEQRKQELRRVGPLADVAVAEAEARSGPGLLDRLGYVEIPGTSPPVAIASKEGPLGQRRKVEVAEFLTDPKSGSAETDGMFRVGDRRALRLMTVESLVPYAGQLAHDARKKYEALLKEFPQAAAAKPGEATPEGFADRRAAVFADLKAFFQRREVNEWLARFDSKAQVRAVLLGAFLNRQEITQGEHEALVAALVAALALPGETGQMTPDQRKAKADALAQAFSRQEAELIVEAGFASKAAAAKADGRPIASHTLITRELVVAIEKETGAIDHVSSRDFTPFTISVNEKETYTDTRERLFERLRTEHFPSSPRTAARRYLLLRKDLSHAEALAAVKRNSSVPSGVRTLGADDLSTR